MFGNHDLHRGWTSYSHCCLEPSLKELRFRKRADLLSQLRASGKEIVVKED